MGQKPCQIQSSRQFPIPGSGLGTVSDPKTHLGALGGYFGPKTMPNRTPGSSRFPVPGQARFLTQKKTLGALGGYFGPETMPNRTPPPNWPTVLRFKRPSLRMSWEHRGADHRRHGFGPNPSPQGGPGRGEPGAGGGEGRGGGAQKLRTLLHVKPPSLQIDRPYHVL